MDNPITILIVEDHQSTLDGLAIGLEREPDFKVVGTSSDSGTGIELAERLRPNIVLLDLHLPGKLGPRSMVEEFSRIPDTRLIIFSAENRMAFIQAVLSMGVSAYLLKSERISTVCETIRQVASGKKAIISEQLTAASKKFTKSEMEVLEMLGRGMKYQDIASQRYTTIATVRKQCETLLLKLGLETREQLIAWAVKNGYGSVETPS